MTLLLLPTFQLKILLNFVEHLLSIRKTKLKQKFAMNFQHTNKTFLYLHIMKMFSEAFYYFNIDMYEDKYDFLTKTHTVL